MARKQDFSSPRDLARASLNSTTHLGPDILPRSFSNPAVPVPSRSDQRLPRYASDSAPGFGRFRASLHFRSPMLSLWGTLRILCRVPRALRSPYWKFEKTLHTRHLSRAGCENVACIQPFDLWPRETGGTTGGGHTHTPRQMDMVHLVMM